MHQDRKLLVIVEEDLCAVAYYSAEILPAAIAFT